MINPHLLSASTFEDKYELPNSTVAQFKHSHGMVGMQKIGNTLYVDEKYFIRREEFRKKVWLQCHENYYAITEHIKDANLAYILARYTGRSQDTWHTYMNQGLFSLAGFDGTIFHYKVPYKQWEFWRITTFLIRRILRLWK